MTDSTAELGAIHSGHHPVEGFSRFSSFKKISGLPSSLTCENISQFTELILDRLDQEGRYGQITGFTRLFDLKGQLLHGRATDIARGTLELMRRTPNYLGITVSRSFLILSAASPDPQILRLLRLPASSIRHVATMLTSSRCLSAHLNGDPIPRFIELDSLR